MRRSVERCRAEIVESPLNPDERENLLRVIYKFSSLSYDEAGMVCLMMQGRGLQQIANERRQSIQAVHARWKALVKRDPVWESLANCMIGSGRGRKKAKKNFKQMDLFDTTGGAK